MIYLTLLTEWNRKMDLIAPSTEDEIVLRHFVDSLTVLKSDLLPTDSRMIDVGTGAGFPGLPIAMARPDLRISLMDAQRKRLSFLQTVCDATDTFNIEIIHNRAEDLARKKEYREKFDVAVARAVAPLNVLSEYLMPFVRPGGVALCWKGPALEKELDSGRKAAHLLGGRLEMPIQCPVAGTNWEHTILPIRKLEKTSYAYPRKAGIPKSHPLGE